MGEKIARVSLTLPQDLLEQLDRLLKDQKYASRSEAIRDSLRDFLAQYRWRRELGGRCMGVVSVLYDHEVRGLADTLVDIQHESAGVIKAVQHLHVDEKNCLETLIMSGQADSIRKLVDRISALRGVKNVKLVVM